jgi:hypothetical protein
MDSKKCWRIYLKFYITSFYKIEESSILGNKITKTIAVILISVVFAICILLILTYTGIAPKIIKYSLVFSGNDGYQEEDKSKYIFKYLIYLCISIFITVCFLMRYFLLKKK